jgi:hypothetical protein
LLSLNRLIPELIQKSFLSIFQISAIEVESTRFLF